MKAIRIHLKQNTANYRREETVNCRTTYPLPPYSTVIGAIHKACRYTEYHPMDISIQGKYGSMIQKVFTEDCFLNSCQDDRGYLVKMNNPDILCSSYQIVAKALKGQGNSFQKGTTIKIFNQKLLDEYRKLNLKERLDYYKSLDKEVVQPYKDKLKELKKNKLNKTDEYKKLDKRLKRHDKLLKGFEEKHYKIPKSYFKTLTKAPKYYELLCEVELIIHIHSDEKTMSDILDNIYNLTAIGRSEDFIEIIDICEVDLEKVNEDGFASNRNYHNYIPYKYMKQIIKTGAGTDTNNSLIMNGTKYFINKNYNIKNKKRLFEKVSVLYTCDFVAEDIYIDNINGENFAVFMG